MHKLYDFMEARERLGTVIVKTKLIHSPVFSEESGNEVYLKPENLQKTGSFKIRGAYNKIAKLSDEEKKKGVIASSAGNHAQGVAYAAKKLGIKAVIVMPQHTPLIKVEATRRYGAEVVLHGEVYDDAYKKALELQKENGYIFVHPFNDEEVLEGQGTIALEILDELPNADIILVPLGGGGLVSGIACAAKLKNPQIKVIGVEPEGAASALAALQKGEVVELKEANTIADGTAVKRIGEINFEYIKKYVDDIITVSDYELMETFLLLVEKHKLIAEKLLEFETLDAKAIKSLFETGKMPSQDESEFPSEKGATFEEAKKALEAKEAEKMKQEEAELAERKQELHEEEVEEHVEAKEASDEVKAEQKEKTEEEAKSEYDDNNFSDRYK